VIRIKDVSKEFKEGLGARRIKAVQSLSLTIEQGEVFGFLGPNGAGKSTTIKILMDLVRPDSGSVSIMGKDIKETEVRKHVGYLPENPYLYDYLSASELLWFAGKASGLTSETTRSRSNEVLDKLELQGARARKLRTYSKGMVQRVSLALALIHDPEVIILDEPMSGLDPIGRKMVGDIILELKSRGRTVLISSHILADVERFCDRIGIIVKGKLKLVGSLNDLLHDGTSLEEIFLSQIAASGGGIEQ